MGAGALGRGERIGKPGQCAAERATPSIAPRSLLRLAALLAAARLQRSPSVRTARRFMQRHLDGCAVMRRPGAVSQSSRIYLGDLLFGAIVSALGCLAGFGAQYALERSPSNLLLTESPAPSPSPFGLWFHGRSGAAGRFRVAAVDAFAQRSDGARAAARWADAERRRRGPAMPSARRYWRSLCCGSRPADLRLGLRALGLLPWPWPSTRRGRGSPWPRPDGCAARLAPAGAMALPRCTGGWARARSRPWPGLGMTALLLLTLARDDLLASWKRSVPADAPHPLRHHIEPNNASRCVHFSPARGLSNRRCCRWCADAWWR